MRRPARWAVAEHREYYVAVPRWLYRVAIWCGFVVGEYTFEIEETE